MTGMHNDRTTGALDRLEADSDTFSREYRESAARLAAGVHDLLLAESKNLALRVRDRYGADLCPMVAAVMLAGQLLTVSRDYAGLLAAKAGEHGDDKTLLERAARMGELDKDA